LRNRRVKRQSRMNVVARPLGTMVIYGFPERSLAEELDLALSIGAKTLEILPDWNRYPDPNGVREQAAERGLTIHSAHGCWGGRTIRATRVDLGSPEISVRRESVDDLKLCVDWLSIASGKCLVVHPGGLSIPSDFTIRRDALAQGLIALAEHAKGTGVTICVENMPPGVHPGSRMADIRELLDELKQTGLALALDTGHANIASTASDETRAAGSLLGTTHVHDNDGRKDSHEPPGYGTVDWVAWGAALDFVGYDGPIMLECIRHLREHPGSFSPKVLQGLVAIDPGLMVGPD
jgi:sugar phosphate isomerase/epimerase